MGCSVNKRKTSRQWLLEAGWASRGNLVGSTVFLGCLHGTPRYIDRPSPSSRRSSAPKPRVRRPPSRARGGPTTHAPRPDSGGLRGETGRARRRPTGASCATAPSRLRPHVVRGDGFRRPGPVDRWFRSPPQAYVFEVGVCRRGRA